jgi:hypothetical protein
MAQIHCTQRARKLEHLYRNSWRLFPCFGSGEALISRTFWLSGKEKKGKKLKDEQVGTELGKSMQM